MLFIGHQRDEGVVVLTDYGGFRVSPVDWTRGRATLRIDGLGAFGFQFELQPAESFVVSLPCGRLRIEVDRVSGSEATIGFDGPRDFEIRRDEHFAAPRPPIAPETIVDDVSVPAAPPLWPCDADDAADMMASGKEADGADAA